MGDGSYLMLSSEIVTSIQEGYKLTIVLLDNEGFKSIGGLSRSLGQEGFGTRYAYPQGDALPGDDEEVELLPVDLASNAETLGAHVIRCETRGDVAEALDEAKAADRTTVIYVQSDRYEDVPSYESWWDVPVAEVSAMPAVDEARAAWEEGRAKEREFLQPGQHNAVTR
jgi:3D-(3,5/4)-trihydroxycyclohexane-1,2-dione acylhydrolase (decyclizing)